METIYLSQKDMLEIYQDGDKYFLRYPTFNITCPEVVKEKSPKKLQTVTCRENILVKS